MDAAAISSAGQRDRERQPVRRQVGPRARRLGRSPGRRGVAGHRSTSAGVPIWALRGPRRADAPIRVGSVTTSLTAVVCSSSAEADYSSMTPSKSTFRASWPMVASSRAPVLNRTSGVPHYIVTPLVGSFAGDRSVCMPAELLELIRHRPSMWNASERGGCRGRSRSGEVRNLHVPGEHLKQELGGRTVVAPGISIVPLLVRDDNWPVVRAQSAWRCAGRPMIGTR
jgi:hypothetical protein